jgi:alpha-beta hydrolase superfamily lysophospholipase
MPSDPKGSVFLLHGFFDHTGIMKNLIRHCLDRQYAVAVYDLPGHGFSSGEGLLINDFSEYVLVLEDFLKIFRDDLPGPFHLIGHSTGGAIAFEYMNSTQDLIFKKVILLAPLIHFASWKITKVGYFFAKPFVKSLPRKFRKNSSDSTFLKKYRKDPLRTKRFPLKWLNAIYKWDKRIVIQGTGDKVVDWKYNIEFLKKKLSGMEVKWIQNARHQLLNENEPIKSEVLEIITEYLEE